MHTRGPATYSEEFGTVFIGQTDLDVNGSQENRDGILRLAAAAYTSYDKHFGENAVAAAEADALGEAIALLRSYVAEWEAMDGQSVEPLVSLANRFADRFGALLDKIDTKGKP